MTSWDPIDRYFGENPFYGKEVRRGGWVSWIAKGGSWLSLTLLAGGVLVSAVAAVDGNANAMLTVIGLVLPAYLFVSYASPGFAATCLDSERESGTLPMTFLSLIPRRDILVGLLAARLRPLMHLVGLSLPLMLAGGLLCGAGMVGRGGGGPELWSVLIGGAIGALTWVTLLLGFLFGASAGAYAAVHAKGTGGAVGTAYGIVVGLSLGAGMFCSCLYLVALLVGPAIFWEQALKKLRAEDVV